MHARSYVFMFRNSVHPKGIGAFGEIRKHTLLEMNIIKNDVLKHVIFLPCCSLLNLDFESLAAQWIHKLANPQTSGFMLFYFLIL